MNKGRLALEIVTPEGDTLKENLVDEIVFRRKERQFEAGSEVAIFPLHGPLLIRIPIAPLRYRIGGEIFYLAVGGGFVEVKKDRVLVVTPRFELVPAEEPRPLAKARKTARQWRKEMIEFQKEMIGYLS